MKGYILSTLSLLAAFGYYLVLIISPAVIPERLAIWLPFLSVIALHYAARRVLNSHGYQVAVLAAVAVLYTFQKTLTEIPVFAYALTALYGVVLLMVALTFPVTAPLTTSSQETDMEETVDKTDASNTDSETPHS